MLVTRVTEAEKWTNLRYTFVVKHCGKIDEA